VGDPPQLPNSEVHENLAITKRFKTIRPQNYTNEPMIRVYRLTSRIIQLRVNGLIRQFIVKIQECPEPPTKFCVNLYTSVF
jgi:hypothetical protein